MISETPRRGGDRWLDAHLRLQASDVEHARRTWTRSRERIVRGGEEAARAPNSNAGMAKLSDVRGRYQMLHRLAFETDRLIREHRSPDPVETLYALDPHLLRVHSEYWEPSNAASLDFLRDEWSDAEQKDRQEFLVFLLSRIFQTENVICLEAGRDEIGVQLAYFLDDKTAEPGKDQGKSGPAKDQELRRFSDAILEIQHTTKFSDKLNWSSKQISDFIWSKFDALVRLGGIPLMTQRYSARRLVDVLKKARLTAAFTALRKARPHEHQQIRRAEALFRRFLADAARLREARSGFFNAYTLYVRSTHFVGGSHFATEKKSELRAGEVANIHALFELHLLNTCLSESGVLARLRYVTPSALLYSFVSGFAPGKINVELVHPRQVLVNPEDSDLESFTVMQPANAFVRGIASDGSISVHELDAYERAFVGPVRATRVKNTLADLDTPADRESMLAIIREFASDHDETLGPEVREALGDLSSRLALTSDSVQRALESQAPHRFDEGFQAYREFSRDFPKASGRNRVLIRAFGHDPSEDGSRSVPRLVCIPIGGGFRNIFKIYNTSVINSLHARFKGREQATTITELLDGVEGAVSGSTGKTEAENREIAALRNFMRAVYATSAREWTLALTFGDRALRALEPTRRTTFPERPLGNTAEGRRHLMAQEIYLLQHFCKRGIAASGDKLSRRQRWLKLAGIDLFKSAEATQAVNDTKSHQMAFDPNSVRQALAAMALLLEWMMLKAERRATKTKLWADPFDGPILPLPYDSRMAWHGLNVAGRTLESYWSDAGRALRFIHADLDLLCQRVAEMEHAATETEEHSRAFWRYINLKAHSLRFLLNLTVDLGVFAPITALTAAPADLHRFSGLLSDHAAFVGQTHLADPEASAPPRLPNPFARFLHDASRHALVVNTSAKDPPRKDEVQLARAADLLSILQHHHQLSDNGFAKSVSRRFLKKYGGDTAARLREVADMLDREMRDPETTDWTEEDLDPPP